jgi:hypothetical protein
MKNILNQLLWPTLTKSGLFHHRINLQEKCRALACFLLIYLLSSVLSIFEWIRVESIEKKIEGLLTIPTYVIMFNEIVNFSYKSKRIEKFCNEIDALILKKDSKTNVERSEKAFKLYSKIKIGGSLLSVLIVSPLLLITGESKVLTFIPVTDGPIFYAMWFLQLLFFIYIVVVYLSMDFVLTGYLMLLSGHIKDVREKIKVLRVEELKKLVITISDVKRMVLEFQDLFASAIIIRTFCIVVCISIAILDSVNEV